LENWGIKTYEIFLFQSKDGKDAEESVNILSQIIGDGEMGDFLGLGIVLILVLLSILALAIFIERYTTIKKAGKIDETFLNNIRAAVAAGNIEGAKNVCKNNG